MRAARTWTRRSQRLRGAGGCGGGRGRAFSLFEAKERTTELTEQFTARPFLVTDADMDTADWQARQTNTVPADMADWQTRLGGKTVDQDGKVLVDFASEENQACINTVKLGRRAVGSFVSHLTFRDDMSSVTTYVLLKNQIDDLAALVDPAQQAQNAAEAAARIADLESKVASAAEIGAAAQPVLAALERLEAGQAAQNTRLAALEARPQGGCCVIS